MKIKFEGRLQIAKSNLIEASEIDDVSENYTLEDQRLLLKKIGC